MAVLHFYNHLQDKGLSEKTISCIHGALHKMLRDALTNELVKENVCDKVHPPKSNAVKKEMHPLKDRQIPAFLAAKKEIVLSSYSLPPYSQERGKAN